MREISRVMRNRITETVKIITLGDFRRADINELFNNLRSIYFSNSSLINDDIIIEIAHLFAHSEKKDSGLIIKRLLYYENMSIYLNYMMQKGIPENIEANSPLPGCILNIFDYSLGFIDQRKFSNLKINKKETKKFIKDNFFNINSELVTLKNNRLDLIKINPKNEIYLKLIDNLLNPYIDFLGPIFTQESILLSLCKLLNFNKINFDRSLLLGRSDKIMLILLDTIQGVSFELNNQLFYHYLGNIERIETENGFAGERLSILFETRFTERNKESIDEIVPFILQRKLISTNLISLDCCEDRTFDNIITYPPRRYRLNENDKFDFMDD